MTQSHPKSILLLSGLSGAGKTTALKTLEDMGWEVVDNLPLVLLDRLLDTPCPRAMRARTTGRWRWASTRAPAGSTPMRSSSGSRRCATSMAMMSKPCSSIAPAPNWSAALPKPGGAIRWRSIARRLTGSRANAN